MQAAHALKGSNSLLSGLQNSTSLFKINTHGNGETQHYQRVGYEQALFRLKRRKDKLSEVALKQKELIKRAQEISEQIKNLVSLEAQFSCLKEELEKKEEEVLRIDKMEEEINEKNQQLVHRLKIKVEDFQTKHRLLVLDEESIRLLDLAHENNQKSLRKNVQSLNTIHVTSNGPLRN